MVNKIAAYISLILLIGLFSCHKTGSNSYSIQSAEDMNDFANEEKEKQTISKKIKEVNYNLQYISNEQMALKDVDDISKISQTQFDSLVKNYDSLLFFNLEISIDNFTDDILKYNLGGDMETNYSRLVEYYSFKMQNDICLVQNEKDTIPCVLYHYERNYGISPKTNVMIGFKPKTLSNLVLVYDNKHLKTGTVKFQIEEKNTVNHPHIKIG